MEMVLVAFYDRFLLLPLFSLARMCLRITRVHPLFDKNLARTISKIQCRINRTTDRNPDLKKKYTITSFTKTVLHETNTFIWFNHAFMSLDLAVSTVAQINMFIAVCPEQRSN